MSMLPPVRRPTHLRQPLRQQRGALGGQPVPGRKGFAAVTLGGAGADRLKAAAPDRAVRLFSPRVRQQRPLMPTAGHEG